MESADVARFSHRISTHPETEMLRAILSESAARMRVERSLLCLEEGMRNAVFLTAEGIDQPLAVRQYDKFDKPLMPLSQHSLFSVYNWAALILPVMFSGKQIGYLALSAPRADTQFGTRQIEVLEELTQAIAFGSQAVFLLESADILAAQTKQVRMLERQEISRHIHREPLQTIIGTKELIKLAAPDHPLTAKITSGLQDATDDLRALCHDLRDETLDMPLSLVVDSVANVFCAHELAPKIIVETDALEDFIPEPPIPSVVREILFEALNNVMRHSQAETVWIRVTKDELKLRLTVSDDGIGMKQPVSKSDLVRAGEQFGVRDMFSQARSVHGTLEFEKNEYGGTTVRCAIPYRGIIVA